MSAKIHKMHLLEDPFEMIKSGEKKIEIRLNDEKRQKLRLGDYIIFSKLPENEEKLKVKITALLHYSSFKEFYQDIPFDLFGRRGKSLDYMLEGTYTIYDKEREKKYGALGIKIKLVE
ncbi:ASCH domain-containing protein [Natronospora cellulosivora (SeqCode)]